ncbi:transposase [Streptomyces sp. NPDC052042]|uniref:transposase n=1 Tax=Streptomyces sp. NPDC052042 TaxID=3365683 RepID=UPI0037D8E00B
MRGAQTIPAPRKYPLELRERAVRMYRTAEPKPVIRRMAEELGVHHEALRNWIRQAEAEADVDERDDMLTNAEREELAALRSCPCAGSNQKPAHPRPATAAPHARRRRPRPTPRPPA